MILIKGGRLIDPRSGIDDLRDIVIEGGIIKNIGKFHESDIYDEIIDARGLVVAPGLVDAHVHFREPGLTHKEDIATGSAAAASGGFTTVVCMANTKPPVDNEATLKTVLELAAKSPINVHTVACVSENMRGEKLTDMAGLLTHGAIGFSDDGAALSGSAFLRDAMGEAARLGTIICLHEEDTSLIGTAGVNDGAAAKALGLTGAPAVSESSLVARDCMLALDTGARVHLQHLSCEESVAIVRLAKSLGAAVTAEVCPHHFSLTEEAVARFGTLAKVNPPLRTERDRYVLVMGLKDGTIDIIATDHAPHTAQEKSAPFAEAPSGMIGLETALALGITFLVRKGHLDLSALIEKMTLSPAGVLGLDVGYLAEGGPADIVIFDEKQSVTVGEFKSKSENSPFTGMELYGAVKHTFCHGKHVFCAK